MRITSWTLGVLALLVVSWAVAGTFMDPHAAPGERIPMKPSPTFVMPTSFTCPNGVTYQGPEGPCPTTTR